jgi:rubrerythrin
MQKRFGFIVMSCLFLIASLAWAAAALAQPEKPMEAKKFAATPVKLDKIKQEDLDKQILRTSIIAELDAINLYEQLAGMTNDEKLKAILLDVAKEEKTHVGEFQALLLRLDAKQKAELAHGEKEVEERTKKK